MPNMMLDCTGPLKGILPEPYAFSATIYRLHQQKGWRNCVKI